MLMIKPGCRRAFFFYSSNKQGPQLEAAGLLIEISKIAGSPKDVSEGSTGAWHGAEPRPSGLRAARESGEVQGQVPVGAAAAAAWGCSLEQPHNGTVF